MTFSQEEKSIVHNNNYHFDGITGSNIQIQVDSDHASQSSVNTSGDLASAHALIDLLRSAIEQGQIAAEARGELQAELATLSAQAASPKPKWAIIKATAGSIKAILENAAGSAIATQAAPYIAALFA